MTNTQDTFTALLNNDNAALDSAQPTFGDILTPDMFAELDVFSVPLVTGKKGRKSTKSEAENTVIDGAPFYIGDAVSALMRDYWNIVSWAFAQLSNGVDLLHPDKWTATQQSAYHFGSVLRKRIGDKTVERVQPIIGYIDGVGVTLSTPLQMGVASVITLAKSAAQNWTRIVASALEEETVSVYKTSLIVTGNSNRENLARIIDGGSAYCVAMQQGQRVIALRNRAQNPKDTRVRELFALESDLNSGKVFSPLADNIAKMYDALGNMYQSYVRNEILRAIAEVCEKKDCQLPFETELELSADENTASDTEAQA